MAKTIVGLYDHLSQARAAVQDLVDEGFERENISLVANASAEQYARYFDDEGVYRTDLHDDELTSGEGAAAGASIGAVIGGVGGLLMGLGLLAVPGVGPALAAGPIVSTLVGAGIGAATGGIIGALVNHGVPEDEAGYYAEGVRRGGSLIMLTVDEDRVAEVEGIMNAHAPVDIEERVSSWRDEGFETYDPEAEPYDFEQIRAERSRYDVPATEEELRMGTREVTGGGVRVRSYVRQVPVEHVESDARNDSFEGTGDDYRQHYRSTFQNQGLSYEHYEPAYRYGSNLALEQGNQGMAWHSLEPEARRRWEERNEGTWTDYRDAVRYSYERERAER